MIHFGEPRRVCFLSPPATFMSTAIHHRDDPSTGDPNWTLLRTATTSLRNRRTLMAKQFWHVELRVMCHSSLVFIINGHPPLLPSECARSLSFSTVGFSSDCINFLYTAIGIASRGGGPTRLLRVSRRCLLHAFPRNHSFGNHVQFAWFKGQLQLKPSYTLWGKQA